MRVAGVELPPAVVSDLAMRLGRAGHMDAAMRMGAAVDLDRTFVALSATELGEIVSVLDQNCPAALDELHGVLQRAS
jgi:hypothetical protein